MYTYAYVNLLSLLLIDVRRSVVYRRCLADGQFRTGNLRAETDSQELLEVVVLPGPDKFPSAGLSVPNVQSGKSRGRVHDTRVQ